MIGAFREFRFVFSCSNQLYLTALGTPYVVAVTTDTTVESAWQQALTWSWSIVPILYLNHDHLHWNIDNFFSRLEVKYVSLNLTKGYRMSHLRIPNNPLLNTYYFQAFVKNFGTWVVHKLVVSTALEWSVSAVQADFSKNDFEQTAILHLRDYIPLFSLLLHSHAPNVFHSQYSLL